MTINLVKALEEAREDSYTEQDARIDELTKALTITFEEYKALNKTERNAIYEKVENVLMNNGYVGELNMWDVAYASYTNMREVEDREYYDSHIEAFRAYEAKMGEPDFDWDFYSDWHKDMFGFRPR